MKIEQQQREEIIGDLSQTGKGLEKTKMKRDGCQIG